MDRPPGRRAAPPATKGPPQGDASGGAWLIVLSGVLFTVAALLVRVLGARASTGQIVFLRFAVGAAGILAIQLWRRERPRFPQPALLAVRGVVGGLAVLCYFLAIQRLGAGLATMLNYMSPVFATLFAAMFLGERVSSRFIFGLVVATTGACLVALGTSDPDHPWGLDVGVLAGAASAVLSGAAITSVRALRATTDAKTVYLGFCVTGCVVASPLALTDWRPLDAAGGLLCLMVGLSSLGAQLLFTQAFGFVRASTGAVLMQLTPVMSALAGFLVLDERFSLLSLLGATLSLGGVFIGTLFGKKAPPPPVVQPPPGT